MSLRFFLKRWETINRQNGKLCLALKSEKLTNPAKFQLGDNWYEHKLIGFFLFFQIKGRHTIILCHQRLKIFYHVSCFVLILCVFLVWVSLFSLFPVSCLSFFNLSVYLTWVSLLSVSISLGFLYYLCLSYMGFFILCVYLTWGSLSSVSILHGFLYSLCLSHLGFVILCVYLTWVSIFSVSISLGFLYSLCLSHLGFFILCV